MDSNVTNFCIKKEEEISQTIQNDGTNFNLPSDSDFKCEDEENHSDTKCLLSELKDVDANLPSCFIKREPEDLPMDFQPEVNNLNAALKEEVDIEEYKPGWELTESKSNSNKLFDIERDQCNSAQEDGQLSLNSSSVDIDKSNGEVTYNCGHCQYKTNKKSVYVQHYNRRHNKQCTDIYTCDECQYKTRIKYDLVQHFKCYHSKDAKIHKCPEPECSYETRYKSDMTSHYKYRHAKDAEVHKCRECSYTTKKKSHLTRHYKHKHSTEGERHKCEECPYETRDKGNLTQHYKGMHAKEVKMYKCEECSFETKWKGGLGRHYKRKHSKETKV